MRIKLLNYNVPDENGIIYLKTIIPNNVPIYSEIPENINKLNNKAILGTAKLIQEEDGIHAEIFIIGKDVLFSTKDDFYSRFQIIGSGTLNSNKIINDYSVVGVHYKSNL